MSGATAAQLPLFQQHGACTYALMHPINGTNNRKPYFPLPQTRADTSNTLNACAGDTDMTADPAGIVPFQPAQWLGFEDVSSSIRLSMQDMASRRLAKV